MTVHEEYQKLFKSRFESQKEKGYAQNGQYIFLLSAPFSYRAEALMLTYLKNAPNATLRETLDYFNKIAPVGLAPDDNGEDL